MVGDVFFVVERSDVGGDECFDGVSESSDGFGKGMPAWSPVVAAWRESQMRNGLLAD